VVGFGKQINAYRVSMKNKTYLEKCRLETTDADGRIVHVLKLALKNWYGTSQERIWSEQHEIGNEPSGSTN
jgi:hypothetical protein